jgi:hypothetical protein
LPWVLPSLREDFLAALEGGTLPRLEDLKIPNTFEWDEQNDMPLLHISFILEFFLPQPWYHPLLPLGTFGLARNFQMWSW